MQGERPPYGRAGGWRDVGAEAAAVTPERKKLIRDTWASVRGEARAHFYHRSAVFKALLPAPLGPPSWDGAPPRDAVTRECLEFVREVLAGPRNPGDPIPWRVVCEGLVVDGGVEHPEPLFRRPISRH